MIQALIFDVGGVLVRTKDINHRRALEKRYGLKAWESEKIVFNSEMGQKAQRGEITDGDLWQWVGRKLQLEEKELTGFQREFWAGDVLDRRLIRFIRQLKQRCQTAVISNATDALRSSLTHQHQIADAFDLIVISAEEGVMKPQPEIYMKAMTRLGRLPEECVFVDDFIENVSAARELGMTAVQFTPTTNLTAVFDSLGIVQ